MKLVICGGRDYGAASPAAREDAYERLCRIMAETALDRKVSAIVSGACGVRGDDPQRDEREARGADGLGERWARQHGVAIERVYAVWRGRYAGPKRNAEMAKIAGAVLALPGDRGTQSMIDAAKRHKLPVFDARRWPGLWIDNGAGTYGLVLLGASHAYALTESIPTILTRGDIT